MRVGAVILAAGSASRFGGGKLLADLDGRPVLGHVLDAAVGAGLDPIVLIGPPDGTLAGFEVAPARLVTNPVPSEGLSSSVRLGLRALEADVDNDPDAAVLLPGDQPRVRPDVIAALIHAAEAKPDAGFVVPRYSDDATPNPVLACRSTWRLADELAGDHGFGPVLAAHPELVRHVFVTGSNPDIDTPADLDRLRRGAIGKPAADVS